MVVEENNNSNNKKKPRGCRTARQSAWSANYGLQNWRLLEAAGYHTLAQGYECVIATLIKC